MKQENNFHKYVGCGYCCIKAQCLMGARYMGVHKSGQCPALFWVKGLNMYRCLLVTIFKYLREDLAIDAGCCSPMNSWRQNVKRR